MTAGVAGPGLYEGGYPMDEKEFNAELISHRSALRGFAYRLKLKNTAAAEDLIQDTYVRALDSREQFDPAQSRNGSMLPWLFTIMFSINTNNYRRDKVQKRYMVEHPIPSSVSYQDGDIQIRLERAAAAIVKQFNGATSETFLKMIGERANYKEEMRRTGKPLGTIKSRLSRARIFLKETGHF